MSNRLERWHLDPRVSLGHIISTIAMVGTMITYVHAMDTKLAVNEARLEILEQQQKRIQENTSEQIRVLASSISNRLNRIDDKLDSMIMKVKEQ